MEKSNCIKVAKEFLASNLLTDSSKWLSIRILDNEDSMSIFWWNEEIQLLDIPLYNLETKEMSGYLLVSDNKELPPVIEYATEGVSLKQQIDNLLKPSLYTSQIDLGFGKYYFYSSTEIYVELIDQDGNLNAQIRIPDLITIDMNGIDILTRNPSDVFEQGVIKELWTSLRSNPPGDKPAYILTNAIPVKYQQNCSSYEISDVCRIDLTSNNSYCAPRRIAGCVPVAWAMLLSAWKRTGFWDSKKIWKDSSCWNVNWPSSASMMNPSQCKVVEKTIWKLNKILKTTAGGSTYNDVIINGRKIFADFGMKWKFYRAENKNFAFACEIISKGQPFIFDGQGKWSDQKKNGHAIIAYGYKKSNRTLVVCMGWGSSFSNKYINHDQYASRGYTYLTSTKEVDIQSDEILEL